MLFNPLVNARRIKRPKLLLRNYRGSVAAFNGTSVWCASPLPAPTEKVERRTRTRRGWPRSGDEALIGVALKPFTILDVALAQTGASYAVLKACAAATRTSTASRCAAQWPAPRLSLAKQPPRPPPAIFFGGEIRIGCDCPSASVGGDACGIGQIVTFGHPPRMRTTKVGNPCRSQTLVIGLSLGVAQWMPLLLRERR